MQGDPKASLEGTPKAQVLLRGPYAILKEPPKQVGHPKVALGMVSSKHRDLLWMHPTALLTLGDSPPECPPPSTPPGPPGTLTCP